METLHLPNAVTGDPNLQGHTRDPFYAFFPHTEAIRRICGPLAQPPPNRTVLIEGESGVGKTFLARALHATSPRRSRPLVWVNCAAMPANLLESELFGRERGASTTAPRGKPGRLEVAHEGTILLEEVAALPPAVQAKLLQVLQDGEFSRLGGERRLQVDVQVLATTNGLMAQAVQVGSFRTDLYHRLSAVRLEVPPLRARREEIPFFVECFFRFYADRYNRPMRALVPETLALFFRYDWPGNLRELERLVKQIVVLGDEAGVQAELAGRLQIAIPR